MTPQYLHVAPDGPAPSFATTPFRLIFVSEAQSESDWRQALAEQLVASGCLYFIAWGEQCSIWHDSLDHANLAEHDYGDIPDDSFIMTTWHEKEPLLEAFWFAEHCGYHPDIELKANYILHLADNPDPARLLALYEEAKSVQLDKNGKAPWDEGYDPTSRD